MSLEQGRSGVPLGKWTEEYREAWDQLPDTTRRELQRTIENLPGGVKGWKGLVDMALEQIRYAAGEKSRVAIVGPVNVGKSTLHNLFIRARKDRAAVSPIPGTTRESKESDAGLFSVIDTPGADAVGVVGEVERHRAFETAKIADLLLVLFDASKGIGSYEKALFDDLAALGKPTVIALNKIDLVGRKQSKVIGSAAANLGVALEHMIPISANSKSGIEQLLLAIVRMEPEIIAALGAAMPHYRWKLSQTVIGRAASAAGAIAVTPLPFLDFIPLVGIQSAMVISIARIYAYEWTLGRARELMAAFGVGILGRTLFYELSKLGGPPTWLLAAGVAAGTTTALGYGVATWFERGETLPKDTFKRLSRTVTDTVLERLRDLGKRRPKRVTLRERVHEALEEAGIGDIEEYPEGVELRDSNT